MKNRVLILHDNISRLPLKKISEDDFDNIVQEKVIKKTLKNLGFKCSSHPFDLKKLKGKTLSKFDFVFNIVESVNGRGDEIYKAPEYLENITAKFTGGSSKVIKLTTDKISTKKVLIDNDLLTPSWISLGKVSGFIPDRLYIVKPINEDASIGIDQENVFHIKSLNELENILSEKKKMDGKEYFAEIFIDGREFNISVMNNNGFPLVLPPAELVFSNYTNGKYKVASYNAKWDESSFEYKNTNRTFDFNKNDVELLKTMEDITVKCWDLFKLKGYARIDFRVDKDNRPWILEINVNPCISPDSGFIAAAKSAGKNYKDIISSIISDLN